MFCDGVEVDVVGWVMKVMVFIGEEYIGYGNVFGFYCGYYLIVFGLFDVWVIGFLFDE